LHLTIANKTGWLRVESSSLLQKELDIAGGWNSLQD